MALQTPIHSILVTNEDEWGILNIYHKHTIERFRDFLTFKIKFIEDQIKTTNDDGFPIEYIKLINFNEQIIKYYHFKNLLDELSNY